MLRTLASFAIVGLADGVQIPIATFDNASGTTWPWETVNDPVMGGQSKSTFQVDSSRALGVWDGEVRIVPFLGAPGFCNLQAPGLYKTAAFPDVSDTDGMVVRARETNATGLTVFNAMVMTKGARHLFKQGVYTANFTLTGAMKEHFVPWSAFQCSWRGQKVAWCPDLKSQLAQVTSVGLGTAFPGVAARFHVEIASLSAAPATEQLDEMVDLATFDGTTKHSWTTENDPVMGGRSDSKFVAGDGYGDYSGTCRIVPALQAPGFTFALTESQLFAKFPDVSALDGLVLGVRSVGGNITNFKVAFCDSRLNPFRCQFQTFKADFSVEAGGDFKDVFVPWSKFSDKWDSSTGKHTAEHPPTAASLKSITQLQIWVEGVAGTFHLQLKYVRAAKAPADRLTALV